MTSVAGDSPTDLSRRATAYNIIDSIFSWVTRIFAISVGLILVLIAFQVTTKAWPAIQEFGLGFLFSTTWNPVENQYGAWPHIYGTLVTAIIALAIALPIGIGVAIFLVEGFLPTPVQNVVVFLVELLAAIPSVVFGIWGLFVLVPLLRPLGTWIHDSLGFIPLFSTSPAGPGVYVASIVLGIMILPIIAAISRDAIDAVPRNLREASLGLGATRWETIFKVILPAASSGIVGGAMLALGRALGETMAVTMLIGNSNKVSTSLFAPGSTVASLLANQFAEASGLQVAALMYAAIVLFALTLIVNVLAEVIVRQVRQI